MLKDFINIYIKFIISLQLKESLNIASAALMVIELWPAFSFKYSANTRLSGAWMVIIWKQTIITMMESTDDLDLVATRTSTIWSNSFIVGSCLITPPTPSNVSSIWSDKEWVIKVADAQYGHTHTAVWTLLQCWTNLIFCGANHAGHFATSNDF